MKIIQNYLKKIQETYLSTEAREVSYRSHLENLLNELKLDNQLSIIHEGKREGRFGIPDFKIKKTDTIIGYIETKNLSENLEKVLKSEQIQKYKSLSNNLLLTNYLEFIWIKDNEICQIEKLLNIEDIKNLNFIVENSNYENFTTLISKFLSTSPQGIASPKKLAESLAIRAKFLKDILLEELDRQQKEENSGRLFGLYDTFKTFVFQQLSISEFTDAFAQNLAYGLFLAKLNANQSIINLYNVRQFIPHSFELLRELVDFLSELDKPNYVETRWIIEEILTLLNHLELNEIQKSLSFNKKHTDNEVFYSKDPYIYFYEDFLASYDQNLRKAKGVYYTPPAIVNFIVRSINDILKEEFEIVEGLSDKKRVTILDFATGTGTFLVEILQQIFEQVTQIEKRKLIIKEHILKNIYGFEYLIAPYTVAHLKLSQFLKEHAYQLTDKERIQIYLTNTLEPNTAQKNFLVPALSKESEEAQKIKNKPILVICGNPPYSISSTNKSEYINNSLKIYKEGLNEQKINLDDDYIKFIRFAQQKIAVSGEGVIAIITNNSYLDGITHRKMRESLLNDFDKIYILNLHGNSIKKEGDDNVFDIRVGVSILICIKRNNNSEKQIYYFSTKENQINKRSEKYQFCLENDLKTVKWTKLSPHAPNFWFVEKDLRANEEYQNFWSVKDIFKTYSVGVKTKIDSIAIDFDEKKLSKRIEDILKTKYRLPEIIKKFKLNPKTTWEYDKAIKANFDKENIVEYDYRPFNRRKLYYDKNFLSRSRSEVMDNFFKKENIGLEVGRLEFIAFVSELISDEHFCGGASYKFPIYVYEESTIFSQNLPKTDNLLFKEYFKAKKEYDKAEKNYLNAKEDKDLHIADEMKAIADEHRAIVEMWEKRIKLQKAKEEKGLVKNENISSNFRKVLFEKYAKEWTAEEILGYVYAILHSNSYKQRFAELLKTDFPKIPLVEGVELFQSISQIGQNLVKAHLLKDEQLKVNSYEGEGSNKVEKIVYNESLNRLYINQTQYFSQVNKEVWEYQIGSYAVLEKYLKDRKEDESILEYVEHIEKIIAVLNFTIFQSKKVDELIEL
jgi:predicted helicase